MKQADRSGRICQFCFALAALVFLATASYGQEQTEAAARMAPDASAENEKVAAPADMRELEETVKALQSEVRALNTQLTQIQSDQRRSHEEVRALQEKLALAAGNAPAPKDMQQQYEQPNPAGADFSTTPLNSSGAHAAPQNEGLEQRVATIEEDQQLLNSKLNEQSQTKVESGSKYRVRFSGLIVMNLYDNRGYVDNQDFPEIALRHTGPTGKGAFGGSLRQSQIGVEAFGPRIAGARTSANINFDFAGGFPDEPNGAAMGLVRLRTATVRFDWADTSIIAGQDRLFFAPLAPTSLATVAIPPLSYAGNLWNWTPQVRVEHTIRFSEKSAFLAQVGILDSLSGDPIFEPQNERYPAWGEQSGLPGFAARIALNYPFFGQQATVGTGGYYGRQFWGFDRSVDGWASTIDISVPFGKKLAVTGAFYRGRAVGGLGGGLGLDVLMSGSLFAPSTVIRGLDSMGGWMQLKFQPWQKFEINGAYGQDNPFASELDRFPAGQGYYSLSLTRNQSPMVNFIYSPRSDVELSLEYRRLRTMVLDSATQSANHFDASVGYRF